MSKLPAVVLCLLLVITMAVGCGSTPEQSSSTTAAANNEPASSPTTAKHVDTDFSSMTWDEILTEAKGQTITWYLWGGNTQINDFIDNYLGGKAAKFGIKINRVGVNNITEAVNITIGEKQAGKDKNGTIDMFWINGSNFMMMKQAGVTFPAWSEKLPNAKYVDWTDPSIKNDMGLPVEGHESPWMTAQLQLVYDSARMTEKDLPKNFAELLNWAKAHPGRFTYVAPPDFMGTRFIKSGIYELTGGYEAYNKDGITLEQMREMSKPMFDYLKEIAPYLWSEGKTYPQASADLTRMFNNNEVDFCLTLTGMGCGADIKSGLVPPTSKVYCMDTAIADTNYVTVTYNGANKAAALVMANILLEPEVQAENIAATSGSPCLDFTKLSGDEKAMFDKATAGIGQGTFVAPEEKARTRAPEVASYLNPFIEKIWSEEIGKK